MAQRRYNERLNFKNNPEVRRAFRSQDLGLMVQALSEVVRQNDPWQVYLLSNGHKAERMQVLLQTAGFSHVTKDRPVWDEDAIPYELRPKDATAIAALKSSGKLRGDRTVSVSNDVMVAHGENYLFKPRHETRAQWQDHYKEVLGGPNLHEYRVNSSIATAPSLPQSLGIVTESVHNVVLSPLSRNDRAHYLKSIPDKMRSKSNGGIFWESPIIGEHIQRIDGISYTNPEFETAKAKLIRALLGFPDCIFGVLHAIVENKIPFSDENLRATMAELAKEHWQPFIKVDAPQLSNLNRVPFEKASLLYTHTGNSQAEVTALSNTAVR